MIGHDELRLLIRSYGGWVVGGVVGLESLGVPVPGETVLVSAALYAATRGELDIGVVVVAAALGATIGASIGYFLGFEIGVHLLARYGRKVGLTPPRLRLGRYLFLRHGAKAVFFGRFVALLRSLAALLAGANRMPWHAFMLANGAGAIAWAAVYGFGPYWLGREALHLARPLGIGLAAAALVVTVALILLFKRNHAKLQADADRLFGGWPDAE